MSSAISELSSVVESRSNVDDDATSSEIKMTPFTEKDAAPVEPAARFSVVFGPITAKNVGQLRVLNHVSFPVCYYDGFYAKVLGSACSPVSFFAYASGDVPVGALCARPEPENARIYLMTISVLGAYRRRGVGEALLKELFDRARTAYPALKKVALHVHTPNTGGAAFYEKMGFRTVETVENYYSNIEPRSALLLEKDI